ncbi:MAG: bifunctional diaminohydroxyphosphoribosylaminopyrimidine deaminase/5-amino-6-(5-phosphoribosylamino)uracil reductase RibD [Pirellulales bacterium]|nr:bifunctional diaminohydroxyphosphoribosylaminopyrimidine deaminase/5-amino-6-(5-phosphoribosylamino)uracil reductase RibD [Pirellulales bacterium]
MQQADLDAWHMRRALALAERGRGAVEPNPLVGCLIVHGAETIGEGWHRRFGGPHAEVEALRVAGSRAAGATLYVTLEPCCHHGKTPPCTDAILAAGIRRVIVGHRDPFPAVDGGGLAKLAAAGVEVVVPVCEAEVRRLNAPYLTLLGQGRPWVIAKWAMTLDGRIATASGDSRWISNERSRAVVHEIRGRVDAIVVGRGTADVDDPLLTARPPGPRTATRVVLDRRARLASDSQLVRTRTAAPVLVVAGTEAAAKDVERLRKLGCEVLTLAASTNHEQLRELLAELGRRRMTNVLVEGGGTVLGALFDADLVDEVHVFTAPRIVGGEGARSPVLGAGRATINDAFSLADARIATLDGDVYLQGVVAGHDPGAIATDPAPRADLP